MKVQFVTTPNFGKLTKVGPQKFDRPSSDPITSDSVPSWKPLNRQQMAKALEVVELGAAGAGLGCLAGYGLQGGFFTSIGLAGLGLLAGAEAGTELALWSSPTKPSRLLPIALVSLAGLALGAVAGTDLLGPGLRVAVVAGMGAGAGLCVALNEGR